MTATYRFPDQLGGGEYETPTAIVDGRAGFDVPGVGRVTVPVASLVEVLPPIPPEPANGSVVRISSSILPKLRFIAERDDSATTAVGDEHWFSTETGPATWADLVGPGSVVTYLVPDPFAEPVTLPWEGDTTYGAKVGARDLDTGSVNDWIQRDKDLVVATLTPALARDKARALWAAADAAEAQR